MEVEVSWKRGCRHNKDGLAHRESEVNLGTTNAQTCSVDFDLCNRHVAVAYVQKWPSATDVDDRQVTQASEDLFANGRRT